LILERDRDAVVTVVASDHFVVDECRFAAHMAAIADYVRLDARPPIVLVGAVPDYSETEYGWIEPGSVLEGSPAGLGIRSVNRFCEKPSRQDAERCLRQGWLWNTMMIVGRAPDLVAACARTIPDVDSLLSSLISTPGTPASTRSFVELPRADFSRDVLQKAGPKLAVAPLPAVGWSDWGSPRRVVESLRGTASPPLWFRGYSESEAGTGPTETWAAAQEDDRRRALAPAGFSRDRN
jgi:mannose-1-phosphate guanylyltransferase